MTDRHSFIEHIPKETVKNLRWRIKVRRLAMEDRGLRRTLKDAAMRDVLFFINGFCWGYDPRAKDKLQPFITYPNQDPVILGINRAIEDAERTEDPIDVPILKSRVQGGSWCCIFVCELRWLRDKMFSAGLMTRNEKLVDSEVDPDAMMWKVAFTLKMLPFWMLPEGFNPKIHRRLSEHTIVNPENGSTFVGYANTADVGRGGRRTLFLVDEFGSKEYQIGGKDHDLLTSLHHNTNCILMPSTYGSDHGAFYEAANEPPSEQNRPFVLDWRDNPKHNRLMYTIRAGVAVAVNPDEQSAVTSYVGRNAKMLHRLEVRRFIKEGKVRAPWYDKRCLRPGTLPRDIARELDMDPHAAVGKLFNLEVLARMTKEKVQPPVWQGRVAIVNGELRLMSQPEGPLKLWFRPGLDDEPPTGRFVVGGDIGTGSNSPEAGNSCLIGGNCWTGEQVLEYVDPAIAETRFARLAVAVCRWLGDALLIWEATGRTGSRFRDEVKETGYWNIWTEEKVDVRSHERTRRPGWTNNSKRAKVELFDYLWVAMDDGLFTPRSAELIEECGGWEWDGEKIVYHGTGHGDRAIGGGLCWKGMADLSALGIDKSTQPAQIVKYGTLAWRMQREKDALLLREEDGEGFGLGELVGLGGGLAR